LNEIVSGTTPAQIRATFFVMVRNAEQLNTTTNKMREKTHFNFMMQCLETEQWPSELFATTGEVTQATRQFAAHLVLCRATTVDKTYAKISPSCETVIGSIRCCEACNHNLEVSITSRCATCLCKGADLVSLYKRR